MIMKNQNIFTIIICSLAFIMPAQIVQKREITPFNKIDASGDAKIIYTNSDSLSLMVEGNVQEINFIETKVENNTLFIKTNGNFSHPFKIKVSGNNLNRLLVTSAADFISTNTLRTDSLILESSSAARIELQVQVNILRSNSGGAADIHLSGATQNLFIDAGGASSVKAYKLNSANSYVTTSGASTAKIFASQKLVANATGASTIKFKGEPKEVTAEGSTASLIAKVSNDESIIKRTGKDSSSTSFNLGHKRIVIWGNDRSSDSVYMARVRNRNFRHWNGFWLGINGFIDSRQNFNIDKPYNYMDLDYTKSFDFQLNLLQHNFHLYKNYINLAVGFGFEFHQYNFSNKTKLNADSSFTWGNVDSTKTYNYQKNRFFNTYISVPVLLDFNTSSNPKKSFHVCAGVVSQFLIASQTKQVLLENGNEHQNIRNDDFNLNPFQFLGYASIGYGRWTVFGQYGLNELFKHNKGPELYTFSFGVRLLGFN